MKTDMHSGSRRIILANWKASLSPSEAIGWLDVFKSLYRPYEGIRVVLAVPDLSLSAVHNGCMGLEGLALSAQDVSPFPRGGYTGATPAAWLKGIAEYVLVGHRERRKYFHETLQDVANKVSEAVEEGLCPVLCSNSEDMGRQLSAVSTSDLNRVVLAYTPDEADALEVAAGRKDIAETVKRFTEMGRKRPVLYGGGVDATNVAEMITIPGLAGVLVARGSLDPREFVSLLDKADQALAGLS